MNNSIVERVNFRTLLLFFIPLGFSAILVTTSHVIINSTLSRAPNPAIVIASYAVARSFFEILERCVVILRQTSSALVRDEVSFKAMSNVSFYVLCATFAVGLIVAYLPVGKWIFSFIMGVKEGLLTPTINAYRILLFVTVLSGIRCFYQGVIISRLKTNWMTFGIVIRLVFMISISFICLKLDWVTHGYVGALIFLSGMFIESVVSVWVGQSLAKQLPKKQKEHPIEKRSQILDFYRPFLFASLVAGFIMPSINIALGWSNQPELAIASYAVGFSVTQLFVSFTMYVHQIVINYYDRNSKEVIKFTFIFSVLPTIMLVGVTFFPLGTWGLYQIIGISGELLDETLVALRVFILFSLVFPWLNYVNGILLLKRQTKIMKFSKMGNAVLTAATLILMIVLVPNAGGAIGALAQSIGLLAEFGIVLLFLSYLRREKEPSFGEVRG